MSMSIRYQKGKRNVTKKQKIQFLGLWVLLTGLWNLEEIQNSRQKRSKKKLVREKRRDTSAWKLLATRYWLLTRFIADTSSSRSKRRVRPWAMIVLINYTLIDLK